jgi:epoxyqueuosine reductase QueG
MEWMANPARESPRSLLPDCRSVIVLGLNYRQSGPKREGSIATYALGRDYHKIIPAMTRPLVKFLEELGYSARATTDSAPLLESPSAFGRESVAGKKYAVDFRAVRAVATYWQRF